MTARPSPKGSPTPGASLAGRPYLPGAITVAGTFLGRVLHTQPFLIAADRAALLLALAAIAVHGLVRWPFIGRRFHRSFISVTLAAADIATVSAALGAVG